MQKYLSRPNIVRGGCRDCSRPRPPPPSDQSAAAGAHKNHRERQPVGWFDTGLDPERESSLLATHSQLCTASRREMSRFGRESDTLAYTRSPTDRPTHSGRVCVIISRRRFHRIGLVAERKR
jgi:hypothetical protein